MRKTISPPGDGKAPGSRILRLVPAALLLCVLAAGLSLALLSPGLFMKRATGRILTGDRAAAWQQSFQDGLRVREPALSLWTAIRLLLFGEGEPGVLVGTDGWLYSNEELAPVDESGRLLDAAMDLVVEVRDVLAARDIALVVALVPTKAIVYPQHLGRHRLSPALQSRYAAVLKAMRERGIQAPDLLSPLRDASGRLDVFLRTDTHWSPDGASVAAEALATSIRTELDARGSPRISHTRLRGELRERRGDLLAFLPLGRLARVMGPLPDRVAEFTTVADADADDSGSELFGTLAIPVALVGTSYSAAGAWDFDGALKATVEADVLKVAEEGRGPFAPMRKYIESPALDDPRPDVVVWEIPERYLCLSTPLGVEAAAVTAPE
jgi:alginate O-acetyltransferase complex protein AlgJ